jgi:ATP-binding cassette subfamily C protein
MFYYVSRALAFMAPREKFKYFLFLILRALVGLLDLLAILAIGFLASSLAINLSSSESGARSIAIGNITLQPIQIDNLPFFGAVVLLIFLSKAAFSILFTHKSAQLLAQVEARAAKVITENLHLNGLERIRGFSRNEILFAVQVGSPSLFNSLLNSISTLVAEAFLFSIVLITFASLSPFVALAALVFFGLIGVVIQVFIGGKLERTSSVISDNSIKTNEGLLDLGEVFREAFIANKEKVFIEKIYNSRLQSAKSVATQYVLQGTPRHIVETGLLLGVSVFIFIQAMAGDLVSAAAVTAIFLTGGLRLTAALIPLQSAILSIQQSIPMAKKALDILSLKAEKVAEEKQSPIRSPNASAIDVLFKNVSFSYRDSQSTVISGISLAIEPGQQAAFIGQSGGGKSTLADLMLGLLQPNSGRILVDGVEPQTLVSSIPGLLGYVPQRPGMVSGNLAENIALGVPPSEVNQEKLMQAIAGANLTALIDSLPDGLKTSMGNSKDDFSGGQLQRIGLARALYNKPKLLVMDEATSALDAESEAEINRALDSMRGKTTVVLIAHRLNTVQKSDKVFLVETGRISDFGTFPELLSRNERVKRLASLMSLNE